MWIVDPASEQYRVFLHAAAADPNFGVGWFAALPITIEDDESTGFVVAQHIGLNNPTTEGWTFDDFTKVGGFTLTAGTDTEDYWRIQSANTGAARYLKSLTSAVFHSSSGWTMTARGKVALATVATDAYIAVADGHDYWTGSAYNGAGVVTPGVAFVGTQLIPTDPNLAYHDYQIIYDPAGDNGNGGVKYYLDGMFFGAATKSMASNTTLARLDFGSSRGPVTDSRWSLVRFQIGQIPVQGHLVVTETDGNTQVLEGGLTDEYTIALVSAPEAGAEVTVSISNLSNPAQVQASPAVLVFDDSNWSTPQTVTVTAVDDTVLETDPHLTMLVHWIISDDTALNGLFGGIVNVNVLENDCGAWGYNLADVAGPGGIGDVYRDCVVDMVDLAAIASQWLKCSIPNDPSCSPS
ncbi:MAG: hypothetical protein NTX52_13370 [Planctomycetota bacterium]|nr:hypothetical protein [Planctomycetota bacterium]